MTVKHSVLLQSIVGTQLQDNRLSYSRYINTLVFILVAELLILPVLRVRVEKVAAAETVVAGTRQYLTQIEDPQASVAELETVSRTDLKFVEFSKLQYG